MKVRIDGDPRASGARHPRFYPSSEGLGLLPDAKGDPLSRNTDGERGIFGTAGRMWVWSFAWTHPQTAVCPTPTLGGV